MSTTEILPQVIEFDAAYADAFRRLNLEWIKSYFWVEEADVRQLENPQRAILGFGGQIFFVIVNEAAVGTCAMIPNGPRSYELAKMAVDPSCRGRGYGDLLIQYAIRWAKTKDATRITLLSNTCLIAAVELYKKHGFKVSRQGEDLGYKRSNIEMELTDI